MLTDLVKSVYSLLGEVNGLKRSQASLESQLLDDLTKSKQRREAVDEATVASGERGGGQAFHQAMASCPSTIDGGDISFMTEGRSVLQNSCGSSCGRPHVQSDHHVAYFMQARDLETQNFYLEEERRRSALEIMRLKQQQSMQAFWNSNHSNR